MRPRRTAVLIPGVIALAALAAPLPAFAAWPHDPSVGIAVAPSLAGQTLGAEEAAVSDGLGGVFVPIAQVNGGGIDIYLQRMTATGVRAPGWPAAGVLLRSLPSSANGMQIVPDGAGGAIVVWSDYRSGFQLAYGQRVNSSGVAQWAANGLAVTPVVGANENSVVACPDGATGAFVAYVWLLNGADYDIYASHLLANGTYTNAGIAIPLGHQQNPSVAPDGAGGLYVSYDDDLSGNQEVRLSHVNSSFAYYFSGIDLDLNSPNDQFFARTIADGAGGVYATWLDDRAGVGAHDLYLTHIDSGGGLHPGIWGSSGNALCTQTGTQSPPQLARDGTSGIYAFWNDGRPGSPGAYGAHLNTSGIPFAGWPVDGKAVNTFGGNPFPYPVADGSGGVLLAMYDLRLGSYPTMFAEGLTSAGNLAPLSPFGGRCVVQQAVNNLSAVTDGAGGAYILWTDAHTGVVQAYIQHLDRYATLGDSRPVSAGIRDVAADQGGAVQLKWNSSWMDGDPDWGIGSYWIWRQAPASLAEAAVAAGEAAWFDDAEGLSSAEAPLASLAAPRPARLFRRDEASATAYAWEFLASQPADGSAQYSYVANTTSDSIGGHNPYTVFMVEAHSALNALALWQSAPDSAYSVDNLPPVAPAPFTAQYGGGTAKLHWNRNSEADLAGYRLYRGASLAFVPGPGNLVSAQPDTGYLDSPGAPYIYKLTAIDIHGNESLVAVVVPDGALSVDDGLPRELGLALASPNPSSSGAVLRFAVPAASDVRISIYDAAGREVRVVAEGGFPAGVYSRTWSGDDAGGGRAASGIYFARLHVGGRDLVRRIALTR